MRVGRVVSVNYYVRAHSSRTNPLFFSSSGDVCIRLDCSGCVYGGYACSQSCYAYEPCDNQFACGYADQTTFCEASDADGDGCTEADGYFE